MTTPAPSIALKLFRRGYMHDFPLKTRRLLLKPVDPADADELFEAVCVCRKHLQKWLPWVPFQRTVEATRRFALLCNQDWDCCRAARFVIRDRAHRRALGIVSFENIIPLHQNCDIGYWLHQEYVGHGLMTEAAEACIRWMFEECKAERIRVAAATTNQPSLGVIERLGFAFEGVARRAEKVDGRWLDHRIYGRLKDDPYPKIHGVADLPSSTPPAGA